MEFNIDNFRAHCISFYAFYCVIPYRQIPYQSDVCEFDADVISGDALIALSLWLLLTLMSENL